MFAFVPNFLYAKLDLRRFFINAEFNPRTPKNLKNFLDAHQGAFPGTWRGLAHPGPQPSSSAARTTPVEFGQACSGAKFWLRL